MEEQGQVGDVHDAAKGGEHRPLFVGAHAVRVKDGVGTDDHLEDLEGGDGDGGGGLDLVDEGAAAFGRCCCG